MEGTTQQYFNSSPTGPASGELTGNYPGPLLLNSAVIGKVLTGFVSAPGTITAADTILSAINKLNGNIGNLSLAQVLATGALTNSIAITSNNGVNQLLLDDTTANFVYTSGAVISVLVFNSSGWQFGADNASSHYFNFGYSHSTGALTMEGNDTLTFQNFANFRLATMSGISASTLLYTNATRDIKSVTLGAGLTLVAGTLSATATGDALTSQPLSQFASTTSLELFGVMSDKTGTNLLVFNTSPTLVTPILGVATATSINKVIFTAPATTATLTIANNTTFSVTGGGTLALGGFTATIPATGTVTLGSPGATGRVFVGTSATAGAGSTTLIYASNAFQNTISTNGQVSNRVTNANAGTAAYAQSYVSNGTSINSQIVFGTGYTTAGLLVANLTVNGLTTTVGHLFYITGAAAYYRWAIGGTAVANQILSLTTTALTYAEALNEVYGTTTGTKHGTATTQKQAFWNATPVVQPTAVTPPAGGVVIDVECRAAVSDLITKLQTIGLTA